MELAILKIIILFILLCFVLLNHFNLFLLLLLFIILFHEQSQHSNMTSVQFSSVAQSVRFFVTPRITACQASLPITTTL